MHIICQLFGKSYCELKSLTTDDYPLSILFQDMKFLGLPTMISVNETQINKMLLYYLDLTPKHGNFICAISSVKPERAEGDPFDILKNESGMNKRALTIEISTCIIVCILVFPTCICLI